MRNPRITYPTIQQNVSAFSILPNFIEVAGRKLDATEAVMDGGSISAFSCIDHRYYNTLACKDFPGQAEEAEA